MIESLIKIGFSENEARVYHSLLELGSATAQQVAQHASVNRPTTYVQLERLMKLGLASSFEKASERKNGASKTYFRAEDPEYLKSVLEKEERKAKERGGALQELLPKLEQLFVSSSDRPRVRFFEGIEGLKTAQEEFLKTGARGVDLILSVLSLDDMLKIFPNLTKEVSPRRVKGKIRSRLIYTSAQGPVLKSSDQEMLRESRFVPKDRFPFSCEFVIFGDNVGIFALGKNPFGILIESKEIADSARSMFNLMWKSTESEKQR